MNKISVLVQLLIPDRKMADGGIFAYYRKEQEE